MHSEDPLKEIASHADLFSLKGKYALITGASSGLGLHFAHVMAKAGANVGLAARRMDRLVENADRINHAGYDGRAFAIGLDVTDQSQINTAFDDFQNQTGRLPDILINNAGIADPTSFLHAEDQETDRVFDINQRAVFKIAQMMSRRWVAAGQPGCIINIASITGMRALGGAASYAASKAAVIHLTKVQALELAKHQIRVNAIAPGYFATDINQDFFATPAGEALIKRIPMRRVGAYQDLDGGILLLASDAGRFMTGTILTIDGGHLCSSL